jgi:hypothetical protein
MEENLTIPTAIDRIIFSSDSPSALLEHFQNYFFDQKEPFLSELISRLSLSRLGDYCDSIVWNEPSQPKYIYEEAHLLIAKQRIQPSDSTDHMVVFRQKEFAYELWKKNRFMELQSILPNIQARLQSERSRKSQKHTSRSEDDQLADIKVGMHWDSSKEDLDRLFKELKRNGLIPDTTDKTLFINTFTRNRDLRDPSIIWNSKLRTLGRLILRLEEYELLIKQDGFYTDFEKHLYFIPIGKKEIGNFKDAYLKSKEPSPKSRDFDVFNLIDRIIQDIVSSSIP